MRSKIALLAFTAFLAGAAAAHDFWIQPSAFRVLPGTPVSFRLLIGDPAAVEHWSTEWRKVASFQDFAPDGVNDLLATLRPLNGATPDLQRIDATAALSAPGTHMLAFASNQALSDLPAAEFEAYARHEGLSLPLAARAASHSAANGRELYSRRAKALVQAGPVPTDSVSRAIGQTLEIVPDRNPYLLRAGEPLGVQIRFHGVPLAGASVVLERLGAGAVHGTPILTDRNGRVSFPIDSNGAWKVNVVWSDAIDDPRADYETIFSSLTFGPAL